MEAIIWKDNTVTFKEEGSLEVITTTPFPSRERAKRFVEDKLGTKLKEV